VKSITDAFTPVRIPAVLLVACLGGCSPVGPDFVKPEAAEPAGWSQPPAQGLETAPADIAEWWTLFDDPALNQLVKTALRNNNTLEIAALRVLEARAQLGIAQGARYPQVQAAAGEATWVSPADNTGASADFWQYGLGASVSWEIDFWGRYRRAIESADATYLASIAAYEQAKTLLTASVADSYTVMRTLEEQLKIAHENLKIQQRSYDIAAVLYRNGADSELDMQQARTLLLATEASVPSLESSLKQALNALSILLGEPPGAVASRLPKDTGIPVVPESVAVGLPADMLRRRPDVREAELLAVARNAQVGLAEADLYPSFSLSGSIGLSAGGPGGSSFGDLFSADALAISAGPSFVWPFLNYGRIKNNVRVQDARLQQALLNYRETVLRAARETEDAMATFTGTRKQAAILKQTVVSARRSNALSTLRYQEGFSDYQRVLNSQQSLFTQQQRYVNVRGENARSLIAICKALGGGWEQREDIPWLDPEIVDTMRQRTDWGSLIEAAYPGSAPAEADPEH
jgi:NodT family efflux transporter outer membrane factor (OMF) lipoprotein